MVFSASKKKRNGVIILLEGKGDVSASILRGLCALQCLFQQKSALMPWTTWGKKCHPGRAGLGRILGLDSGPGLYFSTLGHFCHPTHVRSTSYSEDIQDSSPWGHPRIPWLIPISERQPRKSELLPPNSKILLL